MGTDENQFLLRSVSSCDDDDESLPLVSKNDGRSADEQSHIRDTNIQQARRSFPPIIWFAMKVSCIFFQRNIVVPRKCFHCQVTESRHSLTSSDDVREYSTTNVDLISQGCDRVNETVNHRRSDKTSCKTCSSCWWDHNGIISKYTDEDIGCRYWNHPGSWMISVIVLFVITFWNIYEIYNYSRYQRPQPARSIHLLSYAIFLTVLSVYPVMSLYSKFQSYFIQARGCPNFSWATTLNAQFIVKRFQFIDFRCGGIPGKKFLFVCFAWPVELTIHRILIYSFLCDDIKGFPYIRIQSLICTLVLMFVWSNFQYVMFLCRISLFHQFQLVQSFVELHQDDVDTCRRILWNAIHDFNCYRQFVYVYMMIVFPFSTWAMTTTLCWHYSQRGHGDCVYQLWMIWSQICMFLCLSVLSTGGLDASHMWDHFRYQLLTCRRTKSSRVFWRRLTRQMDSMGIESRRVTWTMVLSFISAFAAVYGTEFESN